MSCLLKTRPFILRRPLWKFQPNFRRPKTDRPHLENFVYISETRVKELIDWEKICSAVQIALKAVSSGKAFQPARTITRMIGTKNKLYSMPGYLTHSEYGALGCKLVTSFPENRKKNIPSILGNILIFDDETGALKAIVAANELTAYRTAAASVIATYYIFKTFCRESMVLAIFGAGVQGEVHAEAFICCLDFKEIRIIDTKLDRAENLAEKLNDKFDKTDLCKAFESGEECVRDADVIITSTYSDKPILKKKWLKDKVHINAVGTGDELEEEIYCTSDLYLDSWGGAQSELEGLIALNSPIKGEVGEVINLKVHPSEDRASIFQSLGMAAEDCAVAKLIYDLHQESKQGEHEKENSQKGGFGKNEKECEKVEMEDKNLINLQTDSCEKDELGKKKENVVKENVVKENVVKENVIKENIVKGESEKVKFSMKDSKEC